MKITLKVEITEKELAEALLPNGGKITDVIIEPTTRARRSPTATTQKETAPKKKPAPRAKKKTVLKG